ncbi:MAG: dihydroorotase [Candidatus Paceibacterota bacterium]|jgi:dihydroorotase
MNDSVETVRQFSLRTPDDFHVHFRQGEMLTSVVPHTSKAFGRALVMPNTMPPIVLSEQVSHYRSAILAASGPGFEPLMTIKLLPTTTPEMILAAKKAGIVAVKLYPEGVTTNSNDGVSIDDIGQIYPALRMMQQEDIVLSIHGEKPGIFILDREEMFLSVLAEVARDFPTLRIVLEHITTASAVHAVKALGPGIAATITLHHLLLTLDDVLACKGVGGESLNPHHYCKPVAKREADRRTLRNAAFSGDPKFFFGSDTAPHLKEKKECSSGCAGVWSAPVALPLLVEIFDEAGKLDRLEAFVSEFGARFYGLPLNEKRVTLYQSLSPIVVPEVIDGVVPFWAGKLLKWQIIS